MALAFYPKAAGAATLPLSADWLQRSLTPMTIAPLQAVKRCD